MAVKTSPSTVSAASRRADPRAGGAERGPGYRPLSAKVPVGMGAAGGILLVVGGLGLHLRATRTIAEGQAAEEVLRVFGSAGRPGWLLAIAGALATAAAVAWKARPLAWKAVPLAATALGIGLVVSRLRFLDERAADLVEAEPPSTEFFSFHAGFGWGAWLLLVGAILLALGALAGVLREADVRKGLAS